MKTSDSLIICGNGPSLNRIRPSYFSSSDLLVIGQGIFLRSNPKFLIYENKDIKSNQYLISTTSHTESDYTLSEWLLLSSLASLISLEAEELQVSSNLTVLRNPVQSLLGLYASRYPTNSILPELFIVDEISQVTILQGLKDYRGLLRKIAPESAPVLNLRGSIIRAISIAYKYGYQSCDIVGLDPSSPLFWWSIPSNENLYRKDLITSHATHIHKTLAKLHGQRAYKCSHIGEYPIMPFSLCIALTARIFLSLGFTVRVDSHDPLIADALSIYGTSSWLPPLE